MERDIQIRDTDNTDLINFQMHEMDKHEVFASAQRLPQECIERAVRESEWAKTLIQDGIVLGIFGIGKTGEDRACAWFLRTTAIKSLSKKDYLILGKICSEWMLAKYNRIENLVWVNNSESIRWLSRLGFKKGNCFPISHNGGEPQLFIHMYKERESCVT